MSMDYLRRAYGVPVFRGQAVQQRDARPNDPILRVTSASHYVHAADPSGRRHIFHPLDLVYLSDGEWFDPEAKR